MSPWQQQYANPVPHRTSWHSSGEWYQYVFEHDEYIECVSLGRGGGECAPPCFQHTLIVQPLVSSLQVWGRKQSCPDVAGITQIRVIRQNWVPSASRHPAK